MRNSFKNFKKECIGCGNIEIWRIIDIVACCWQIQKFVDICPCKNCLVKVTCKEICFEKEKAKKLCKELKEIDITYFAIKKKKRG